MNAIIVLSLIMGVLILPITVYALNSSNTNTNHASVSLYVIENPNVEQNSTLELTHESLADDRFLEEQKLRSPMITGMAIGSGERIEPKSGLENILKTIIVILTFTFAILLVYLAVLKKRRTIHNE